MKRRDPIRVRAFDQYPRSASFPFKVRTPATARAVGLVKATFSAKCSSTGSMSRRFQAAAHQFANAFASSSDSIITLARPTGLRSAASASESAGCACWARPASQELLEPFNRQPVRHRLNRDVNVPDFLALQRLLDCRQILANGILDVLEGLFRVSLRPAARKTWAEAAERLIATLNCDPVPHVLILPLATRMNSRA